MENRYLPEGRIINTEENRTYISNPSLLADAAEKDLILEAVAVKCDAEKNLYVDLGFCRAVIPKEEAVFSVSGEPVKDIAVITRVGKPVCFKVLSINCEGGHCSVILSRRLAQMECHERKLAFLSEGDVIDACITHTEQFGAFCDIGCGLIALLPVDCISVSRISHPRDRFFTGQHIKAVIKSIDNELHRITLSHKELLGTWQENTALFHAGETVSGIIRSVEPYGIFVELAPNLAGLAEWSDGVFAGQRAAVYIKSIIPEKHKVKLVLVDTAEPVTSPTPFSYFTDKDNLSGWSYFSED